LKYRYNSETGHLDGATERGGAPTNKTWCESDDPEFAAKAADVVGLYMAPPENDGCFS
jgi:hypothetical protein